MFLLQKLCTWIAKYPKLDAFFSHFKWYNNTHDLIERLWEDDC